MDKDITYSMVGIDHKTASVAEREKYQIGKKELAYSLQRIYSMDAVEGVMILSTCNRLEIYLVHKKNVKPFDVISQFFEEQLNLPAGTDKHLFRILNNHDVTDHIFRVISGLESMVIGEYQIQGQIKEAYSLACSLKTVDKILHKLLHAAFRTGKKVRTNTKIGNSRQSVSGAASGILISQLDKNAVISIIGINENSKIVAMALSKAGFKNLIFINRTVYKAQMMAHNYSGEATGLSELESCFAKSNAVYTSTGAPGVIINDEVIRRLVIQDKCPKLIIDMAVPRDIAIENIPDETNYYDIGGLKDFLKENRDAILKHIPDAEEIIENESEIFHAWSDTQDNELINPYAEKFEIIRQQLIEEYKTQMPKQTLREVDKLTKSLLHRLQSDFVRALIHNNQKNGKD